MYYRKIQKLIYIEGSIYFYETKSNYLFRRHGEEAKYYKKGFQRKHYTVFSPTSLNKYSRPV